MSVFERTSELNRTVQLESAILKHYEAALGGGIPLTGLATAEGNSLRLEVPKQTLQNISRVFSLAREKADGCGPNEPFEFSLKRLFTHFFEIGNFENSLELALISPEVMTTFAKQSAGLLFLFSPHVEGEAASKEPPHAHRNRLNILLSSLQKLASENTDLSLRGQLLLVRHVLQIERNTKTFLELHVTPYPFSQTLNDRLNRVFLQIAKRQPWQVLGLLSQFNAAEVT